MDTNTIEIAIVNIKHNIECLQEARQNIRDEEKIQYDKEIRRLKRLLLKYEK